LSRAGDGSKLNRMDITSSTFGAYLKCPTKCFLRAHGEERSGNEYADWVQAERRSYRAEGIKRLTAGIPPDECATGIHEPVSFKTAKWRFAVNVPARALKMESGIHAVERIPPAGRGRPAQFIPIRFIYTNKLKKNDKLLVAYDALVLSGMSGRAGSRALDGGSGRRGKTK